MKNTIKKTLLSFILTVLSLLLLTASAGAIIYCGDIDNDGKVTAADARLVLRMTVGLEKLKLEEPELLAPQKSETLTFQVIGGGSFVAGESKINIDFTPNADEPLATLRVVDKDNQTVFSKELSGLVKNKTQSVVWDGKNSSGSYVPTGDYSFVCIYKGKALQSKGSVRFMKDNIFAGGCGTASKPFLVATADQFRAIGGYPTACFKQTADIDFSLDAVTAMFTQNAFQGTYDGCNKKLENISGNHPLFDTIASTGTVKNVIVKGGYFNTYSVLTKNNNGRIMNCVFDTNCCTATPLDSGMIAASNNTTGIISDCTVSGIYSASITYIYYFGGVCGLNGGKIYGCVVDADVISPKVCGGIAGRNSGILQDCVVKGTVSAKDAGGCVNINNGQILNCRYTGPSEVSLAYSGSGVIA